MKRLNIVLFLLFFYTVSFGQVTINEFMASNTSTVKDPDYNNDADWIELYNNGETAVNLNGYFLTDNLSKPNKWTITNLTIEPKGFAILWADSKDSANHTNFNLSATAEQIGLFKPDLSVVDTLSYGVQDPNISLGRSTDGGSTWTLFTKATPGSTNNSTSYTGIVKSDPSFSIPGGVYHNAVTLSIKSIFGGVVRFTLDGTEPNEQSPIASEPITIDKNTVVRARIHKEGEILGPVNTNTYLIDTENKITKLPIVCVTSDPVNFWDPVKGIYTVHTVKPDWEIPINIELYENDGRAGAAFNLKAGAKSTGLYSWQLPEKMLGITFRKEYGVSKLEYPLIFDKGRKVFKTFSLRASGSDWGNTMFRDGMIQTAAVENTNIDNSGFRACVVYINGQYMGIHNIREKIDEDYIVGNHGLEPGTFDMIEEVDAGHYAETGDFVANDYFLSLISKDLSNQANYDAVAAQMDIEDFTDVVCTEVYSGNSSIGHNLMKYKPKDSGKWKWILMDFDRGFFGANNQMISFYINDDGWPFKNLMNNADYKKHFGRKLSDLMFTTFNPDRIIGEIDDHKRTIEAEMPNHINRWAGTSGTGNYSNIKAISSVDYWHTEVEKLRTFAKARPGVILNDLTHYGFQAPVPVSVTTFPAQSGVLTFNGLKIPVDVCSGGYPKGETIKLSASAKDGYKFVGWKINSDSMFIPKQSIWKYSDTGTDLGTSWKTADFNDTNWKSGLAELGYGDGDEKTIIGYGSDVNNRYITSYFRTSFTVKNKQTFKAMTLMLKCDDGAVVYLNGTEIQRYNMPAGDITSGTLASTSIAGTAESAYQTFNIGTELLTEGNNIIAVEVHQAAANSSDLSFDMELSAMKVGSPNYQSTASELVVNTQSALDITAVFEGDGKCTLPSEISGVMTLHKSCSPYIAAENVNITTTGKLIIEPGVEIWMSDGVSISSLGPIKAKGTKTEPVIFKSNPQSPNKKWGNITIKNASDTIWFKNVIIENASEGPNPVRDIAALAIDNSTVVLDSISVENIYKNPINVYNSNTTFINSRLHSDYTGCDLINVKRGKILMLNDEFIGNDKLDCDAIDFGDMSNGSAIVKNSYFHDMDGFNSDAVDLGDHSKNVIIDGIVAYNFQDKGVSIGQQSSTKITNSVFINCGMGAGMKDSSSVHIDHCTYYGNFYALANYQKHVGDAGSNLVVTNTILSNSYESGYFSDEYSAMSISNSSDDTEALPAGNNNLNANPLFTNPALNDFSLLSGSPLIGAATNGTIGANLKLPQLPVSAMISDIAYMTDLGMEDLEFIGLYNPGNSRIQLDSCQFASGVNFMFPQGTSIGAKEKIYITSNASSAFWNNKGANVYQWESGRLADEGEKIQLVNKYGKVIDQVIYNNKSPWPLPQNSQQGITLNSYEVDNHFGENWKLLPINGMVSTPAISSSPSITVYPNPATDQLRITVTDNTNLTAELYSSLGQLVKQIRLNSFGVTTVDVSGLNKGIYLLRAGSYSTKVVINK
ncbi:MAG: CotH kinase family protein [Candidatus Saccharibacteria bacterium]